MVGQSLQKFNTLKVIHRRSIKPRISPEKPEMLCQLYFLNLKLFYSKLKEITSGESNLMLWSGAQARHTIL